jgi:hypothetical protein
MSTRKKKDVRAAAQVTEEIEETEEKKTPETADVPTTAGSGSNLWVVLMLVVPLGLCLLWGALTS